MTTEHAPSDDDVLHFLAGFTRPASPREIAAGLTLRHAGRRALPKILSRLKRRGLVQQARGGRYQLQREAAPKPPKGPKAPKGQSPERPAAPRPEPAPRPAVHDANLLTGRLVAHRDGYGFVVPETPRKDIEGDLFIPPDQLGDAMHGDRVIARIERRRPLSYGAAGGAGRAEGRIVRVMGRAHPTVVGLFRYGHRGNVVLPYETRITQEDHYSAGRGVDAGTARQTSDRRSRRAKVAPDCGCRNWTAPWSTSS